MGDPHDKTTRRSDAELLELLVRRAIEPLAPHEQAQLQRMLSDSPDADTEGWDRAAAAVYLAVAKEPEEMPASLRTRLERDAASRTRATSNRSESPWNR